MTLRKNPAHPAAAALMDADFAMPAVSVSPSSAAAAAPAQTPPAPVSTPTPAQPQAPAAPASQPAAQPVLSKDEVTELQARLAQRNDALLRLQSDNAAAIAKAREEEQAKAETFYSPELERLKAELAANAEKLSRYEGEQRQRDLDNLTEFDVTQLGNIDQDVAKDLQSKVLRPIMDRFKRVVEGDMAELRRGHEEELKSIRKQLQEQGTEAAGRARAEVNRKILDAIPDFVQLKDSSAFQEFMSQRPDGSRQTFGEAISSAYRDGDSEFVINQVRRFQKGRPDLTNVAEVDLTGASAQQAQAPTAKPKYRFTDLGDKKTAYQQGRIDRKEYQAFLAAFEEAEREGRVS